MKGQLIIPFGKKTKRTSFEGNPWYNLMGMRYLNDKYTDNCVVIPNKKIKPKAKIPRVNPKIPNFSTTFLVFTFTLFLAIDNLIKFFL